MRLLVDLCKACPWTYMVIPSLDRCRFIYQSDQSLFYQKNRRLSSAVQMPQKTVLYHAVKSRNKTDSPSQLPCCRTYFLSSERKIYLFHCNLISIRFKRLYNLARVILASYLAGDMNYSLVRIEFSAHSVMLNHYDISVSFF